MSWTVIEFILLVLGLSLFWANVFVCFKLWTDQTLYSSEKKLMQTFFVWLLPIVGPATVFWLLTRGDMNEPGRFSSPESEAARKEEGRYGSGR